MLADLKLYVACLILRNLEIRAMSDTPQSKGGKNRAKRLTAAQRSEIQIYALNIHSKRVFTRGDGVLQRLADSTGGQLYIASSAKELAEVFAQIGRDLRTQYFISFPAQQAAPGYHSLRVEVRNSRALAVHARQGYYALGQ